MVQMHQMDVLLFVCSQSFRKATCRTLYLHVKIYSARDFDGFQMALSCFSAGPDTGPDTGPEPSMWTVLFLSSD